MEPEELTALAAKEVGVHPECVMSAALTVVVCDPGDRSKCGTHVYPSGRHEDAIRALARGIITCGRHTDPAVPMSYLAADIACLGEATPHLAIGILCDAVVEIMQRARAHNVP